MQPYGLNFHSTPKNSSSKIIAKQGDPLGGVKRIEGALFGGALESKKWKKLKNLRLRKTFAN